MKQKETISEGKAMNRARRWMAEHGKEILRDLPGFAAEAALVILVSYLFSRTPWMAAMEARFEPRWLRVMLGALAALLRLRGQTDPLGRRGKAAAGAGAGERHAVSAGAGRAYALNHRRFHRRVSAVFPSDKKANRRAGNADGIRRDPNCTRNLTLWSLARDTPDARLRWPARAWDSRRCLSR